MSRTWSVVVVLSLLCSLAIGQEPRETPQVRAERILEQQTKAYFIDDPLGEILQYLAKKHELPIEISPEASKAGLVKIDQRLTIRLRDLTLRSCLSILCDQYGLNYSIKPDGTLQLIPATKENLAAPMESKAQLAAKDRLLKLLQDKTSRFQYIDVPLKDILEYLGDEHELNVFLDPRAEAGAMGFADEPCSMFNTLPLDQGLRALLAPLPLQVIVRHEAVVITKRDDSTEPARTPEVEKAYEVAISLESKKRSPMGLAREFTKQAKALVICDYRAFRAAKIDLTEPFAVIGAEKVPLRDVFKSLPPAAPALKFIDRDGVILITLMREAK